ncbi:MAG TPA: hypothetical protein VJN67_09875 [Stellaceae bacterium]|nr:hypothetical protein [Stellaceae bacterium]
MTAHDAAHQGRWLREPALPGMLAEVLVPFAVIYELASLALARLRDRLNHAHRRCPS